MPSLMIENGTYEINLASYGEGPYTLLEYKMGAPQDIDREIYIPGHPLRVCVDTMTLAIKGNTREKLADHVTRLYHVLSEAKRYWIDDVGKPIVIVANVPGQAKEFFSSIVDFTFIELPDTYMDPSGLQREATLGITRTIWSSIPPQTKPEVTENIKNHSWSLSNPNTEYPIRFNSVAPYLKATGGFKTDDNEYVPIFLSSSERMTYAKAIVIYHNGNFTEHPHPFYDASLGTHEMAGNAGLYVNGSRRYNGIVFRATTSLANTFNIHYWTGSTWTAVPNKKTYVSSDDTGPFRGVKLATWGQQTNSYTWQNTWGDQNFPQSEGIPDLTNLQGYWIRFNWTPSYPDFKPLAVAESFYIPTKPFFDTWGTSSLPQPTRMKIQYHMPQNLSPVGEASWMEDYSKVNRIVIATNFNIEREETELANLDLVNKTISGFCPVNRTMSNDVRAGSVYGISSYAYDQSAPTGDSIVIEPVTNNFTGNYLSTAIWNSIHMLGGAYRVYARVRFTTDNTPSLIKINFRALVSPRLAEIGFNENNQYVAPDLCYPGMNGVITSKVVTISTSDSYVAGHTRLLDFGVIKPVESGYTGIKRMAVNLQVALTGAATNSLKIYIHELIILPVNNNFTIMSGGNMPGAYEYPYNYNYDSITLDGFSPSNNIAAYVKNAGTTDGLAGVLQRFPDGAPGYNYQPWYSSSGQIPMIYPGKQRFYFLPYKIASNGAMVAPMENIFSVYLQTANQYLILPQGA